MTDSITAATGRDEPLLTSDFDQGLDGFQFKDDAFFGTQNGDYALGWHGSRRGLGEDGVLRIVLGGRDDHTIADMSGAFTQSFTLAQETEVSLTFGYHLRIDQDYEPDEFASVLAAVDGRLLGDDGEIARLYGDGNGGPNDSTGWQEITINLGTLSAGDHELALGGYNNKKTSEGEFTNIAFDDVTLATVNQPEPGSLVYDLAGIEQRGGIVLGGEDSGDRSGHSIAFVASDVGGQSLALIGAPSGDPDRLLTAGEVRLVALSGGALQNSLTDLGELNGLAPLDELGSSLSAAGDFNGDGWEDLIVGAPGADPGGKLSAGEAFVVFGREIGASRDLDLSQLDGSNGFRLTGSKRGGQSGASLDNVGDVNGDGFEDLLIGSPGINQATVIFGSSEPLEPLVDLSSLSPDQGFHLMGWQSTGLAVAGGGDFNGDGLDDLVVAAPLAAGSQGQDQGELYLVYGQRTYSDNVFDLQLADDITQILGATSGDRAGTAIELGPDLNGDGFAELIIGTPFSDPQGVSAAGEVTVIFGSTKDLESEVNLSQVETDHLKISGVNPGDGLGTTLSDAGDINGDGFADLLIGAAFADPLGRPQAGAGYVIFGGPDLGQDSLDLNRLAADQGVVIAGAQAGDRAGSSLAAADDLDGDGLGDLIIGAPFADEDGQVDSGAAYILFGKDLLSLDHSKTALADLRSEGLLQAGSETAESRAPSAPVSIATPDSRSSSSSFDDLPNAILPLDDGFSIL